ncbi:unnamed protein product, partial [Meganyctiphanes norvegica]
MKILLTLLYYLILGSLGESTKDKKTSESTLSTSSSGTKHLDVKKEESARLPLTLFPIHYVIKLRPFLHGDLSIQGSIDIDIIVKEPTDIITLNMADIITLNDTAKVLHEKGQEIGILRQEYDPHRQFYIAHLSQNLEVNETYNFHLEFQGLLNDKLVGFYKSSYTDELGNKRLVAATQFSPTDARKAFPGFDEPSFKATFDIWLARQRNMTALSNMPIINTIPIENEPEWLWDIFNTTVKQSTYILGFLVCDYQFLESSNLTSPIFKVWTRPDALEQAAYALEAAPAILTFLEQYFSIPFPLPKLDMVTIPDFKFNAMENWGLIDYRETAMLYDKLLSSASQKMNVGYVMAHELAHQWFGNLVTPAWWSDLWLKEGFASYMGYVALDAVQPTWSVLEQFTTDYIQNAMSLDSLQSSHPISVTVDHPDEISEIFDAISYRKGASIIQMMELFLSEATFRKGLTNYLNDLAYSNAEQDDLWSHLTSAAHEDDTLPKDLTVKSVMDTWTLKMGYPVVTITRNGTNATIDQKWFLLDGSSANVSENIRWWIPLTYTSQDNPDFANTKTQKWMSETENEIQLIDLPKEDLWMVFNIQQSGYYRVNYDELNWKNLIDQLKMDHLVVHQINRGTLLDDSLNLARAGLMEYPLALNLTQYLNQEKDFVPWQSAFINFGYLNSMFSRTAGYGELKDYLKSLVVPLYEYIGFEDSLNDPFLTQYQRVSVVNWACKLGYKACVDKAIALYQQWMISSANESVLTANVQRAVMCTGISSGGEDEWNAAWIQYLHSNVGAEREDILDALGCTQQVWILARYLDFVLSPEEGVKKQDATRVFAAVAKNPAGQDLAWNFLQDRWEEIFEYFGPGSSSLSKMVKSAAARFNTQLEVQELENFKGKNSGMLGSAARAVDQALESAKINVAWKTNYYDIIRKWFSKSGFVSAINKNKLS